MKQQFSVKDKDRIREYPALYVGHVDIRGVLNLLFDFVKDIIYESKQANVVMEIHSDECVSTFHITCDYMFDIKENIGLYVIEALSSSCGFSVKQDIFTLWFEPDREVFSYETIEYHCLFVRLTELAMLNTNMKFLLTNHENRNVIQFPCGLETMLMTGVYKFGLVHGAKPLSIYFSKDDIEVRVSMIYGYAQDVTFSYVNNEKTNDGGSHVEGLYDGLLHAFQKYDNNLKISRKDVAEGFNFVISLTMDQPQFAGAVNRYLTNEEVYYVVMEGVLESIISILYSDPSFFYSSRVIQKAKLRRITSNRDIEDSIEGKIIYPAFED